MFAAHAAALISTIPPWEKRRQLMKFTRISLLVLIALALSLTTISSGQTKRTSRGQTKTVTGCLQKGDETGEFQITENGKSYGLRSSTIKLADHLGHMVTVSGRLQPEAEENEANEREKKGGKESNEAGDISVTKLKMVSSSCQ
jgi:hypothetical protein